MKDLPATPRSGGASSARYHDGWPAKVPKISKTNGVSQS